MIFPVLLNRTLQHALGLQTSSELSGHKVVKEQSGSFQQEKVCYRIFVFSLCPDTSGNIRLLTCFGDCMLHTRS